MPNNYDWDSVIPYTKSDFVLLAPGTYHFIVTNFDRAMWEGNATMDGCPMAKLKLELTGEDGATGIVNDTLFIRESAFGKVTAFFVAIGQIAEGAEGSFRPKWDQVLGASGDLILDYDNRKNQLDENGKPRFNRVKQYLPAQPAKAKNAGGWRK